MNAIVTGGLGFIGSNLCEHLVAEGADVAAVDDGSTGSSLNSIPSVAYYDHAISNTDDSIDFMSGLIKRHNPSAIFHLAARPRISYSVDYPVETFRSNLGATFAILESVRRLPKESRPRIVYSSSSSTYGNPLVFPTPESHVSSPVSPYALQKYQGEMWCQMFSHMYGLETVSLRYFNVFGPRNRFGGSYSTALAAWLYHVYIDEEYEPYLEGDGTQSRDFCYVDNVVMANVLAATCSGECNGDPINIAQGSTHSLLECKEIIENISGKDLPLRDRPPRVGDVKLTWADIRLAQSRLGYQPDTGFVDQVKKMAEWYKGPYRREVRENAQNTQTGR